MENNYRIGGFKALTLLMIINTFLGCQTIKPKQQIGDIYTNPSISRNMYCEIIKKPLTDLIDVNEKPNFDWNNFNVVGYSSYCFRSEEEAKIEAKNKAKEIFFKLGNLESTNLKFDGKYEFIHIKIGKINAYVCEGYFAIPKKNLTEDLIETLDSNL